MSQQQETVTAMINGKTVTLQQGPPVQIQHTQLEPIQPTIVNNKITYYIGRALWIIGIIGLIHLGSIALLGGPAFLLLALLLYWFIWILYLAAFIAGKILMKKSVTSYAAANKK